jgi:hypothetical protein
MNCIGNFSINSEHHGCQILSGRCEPPDIGECHVSDNAKTPALITQRNKTVSLQDVNHLMQISHLQSRKMAGVN